MRASGDVPRHVHAALDSAAAMAPRVRARPTQPSASPSVFIADAFPKQPCASSPSPGLGRVDGCGLDLSIFGTPRR